MSNIEDISKLLRENVLPRLDAHEAELYELRAVTWPVCQALWDRKMPFMNISMKKRFFKFLHVDELRRLLKSKAIFANINDVSLDQEIAMLTEVRVE
ncbi:hypothetical protein EBT25_04915 [bacterium]|jgi:hypothetical protein|nr:hypothetical protein [bacterium]